MLLGLGAGRDRISGCTLQLKLGCLHLGFLRSDRFHGPAQFRLQQLLRLASLGAPSHYGCPGLGQLFPEGIHLYIQTCGVFLRLGQLGAKVSRGSASGRKVPSQASSSICELTQLLSELFPVCLGLDLFLLERLQCRMLPFLGCFDLFAQRIGRLCCEVFCLGCSVLEPSDVSLHASSSVSSGRFQLIHAVPSGSRLLECSCHGSPRLLQLRAAGFGGCSGFLSGLFRGGKLFHCGRMRGDGRLELHHPLSPCPRQGLALSLQVLPASLQLCDLPSESIPLPTKLTCLCLCIPPVLLRFPELGLQLLSDFFCRLLRIQCLLLGLQGSLTAILCLCHGCLRRLDLCPGLCSRFFSGGCCGRGCFLQIAHDRGKLTVELVILGPKGAIGSHCLLRSRIRRPLSLLGSCYGLLLRCICPRSLHLSLRTSCLECFVQLLQLPGFCVISGTSDVSLAFYAFRVQTRGR